jgi:poly(3-hydroxybutyrate) depolymerase
MTRFVAVTRAVAVATLVFVGTGVQPRAEVLALAKNVGGTMVSYKVVLPTGYDPSRTYPAILAFGGGPQTMNTVDNVLMRNLRAEAEKRGYIVIAPAAPNGDLFFDRGARIFPAFLTQVLADYRIEGGKFHVAGPSNGGIAAFHVAALHPQYFRSITAFPGYMWNPSADKLRAIANICVFAYVGENDDYRWHDEMKREVEFMRANGTLARYSEEKGQPHRIATLADGQAGRLFDGFEQARKTCTVK